MKTQTHNQKGFTLVETLVSLGIFVVVMTAAVSSLVVVNNAALRAQQMRTLLDNINFAMDSMVRTVRTAEGVACGSSINASDCPIGGGVVGTMLYVKSTLGQEEDIVYRLNNGVIQKQLRGAGGWLDMTSPEVQITMLRFYVVGNTSGDKVQPLVRMFVGGTIKTKNGQSAPFTFQTAITPRAPGL
jgi:prepilin-type N-terminal cleavage/methylation domain-containing protein